MSVFDMIGSVLIGPLKTLFEVIFSVAYKVIGQPGPAIIVLSLVMNILVLPLYRRADAIQIQARDTENKLKDVVTHIKKTFSGDERMMILQTYYRQNNYNPLSVLSGSVSLLLEIPFFMAAYQFLSGLDVFSGTAFGPISDLSAPDGLLHIGTVTVNVLPFVMTLINVISSALYLKGFPLKSKIQLYGMALFFLVFLYGAPSALVFYWTLNNAFSLVKTLFYRMKNSKRVLKYLLGILGAAAIYMGISMKGPWRSAFMIAVGVVAQLPWLIPLVAGKLPFVKKESAPPQPNTAFFIAGAAFLTVLVGLLIPSTYIAASPQEYIDLAYFYHPAWYIVYTLCLSAGTFLVWMGVFYWLANPRGKVIFSRLVWMLCGVMLVNYMFFGTGLGVVSPDLQYADGLGFQTGELLLNLLVAAVLAAALYLLHKKIPRKLTAVLLAGVIALTGMSIANLVKVTGSVGETKAQMEAANGEMPSFRLSKNGKNVVVIMLDRAIGPYLPYIMEEKPELKEQFDGFVYYSNTLAYGSCTNFGAPALYGGYEYTPVNMNLRDTMLLEDKHNEALKVLPKLFSQEGYKTTVIDPSYAGYQWIPDLSIYDDLPEVSAYLANGRFNDLQDTVSAISARKRNFFFFSLMKTLPVFLQEVIYDDGQYRAVPSETAQVDTSGVNPAFMNAYNVMDNFSVITDITDDSADTFMFMRSNITHEATILQEPDYVPSSAVDNSRYYTYEEGKTITAGENAQLLRSENAISHYHVNMAGMLQLGKWFDYLRENGVYDNTRIILVADHGWNLGVFDHDQGANSTEYYRPLLLVKDFYAHGFTESQEFMTNADVPVLALEELIQDPVNPYTGNPINSDAKAGTQWVIISSQWEVGVNNGHQFIASRWASVSGDVNQKENWSYQQEETVLPLELQKD